MCTFTDLPILYLFPQARLAFCKFLVTPSTLLILDEPTNHLDIPSKEMLEVGCSSHSLHNHFILFYYQSVPCFLLTFLEHAVLIDSFACMTGGNIGIHGHGDNSFP